MSKKNTSLNIPGLGAADFLVHKTSRLQPDPINAGYYTRKKHLNMEASFPTRFIESFASQVDPNTIPGFFSKEPPIETSYILSELSEPLLTEDNNNLIIE